MSQENISKATEFFQIQNAVASVIPVDEKHDFYEDFSPYRTSFQEKHIYRNLAIDSSSSNANKKCNPLATSKKIFLSGYRGTGKTSELLKLRNAIHSTECFFTIFVDISDEELDTNNIETVDILILMLEKLLQALEKQGAWVGDDTLVSFYKWYETRIEEVNNTKSANISIEAEASASVGLLSFLELSAKTKSQLKGTAETKVVIRRVFNQYFSDFVTKFNEFILHVKSKLKDANKYEDILFIIDGFEKIGTLADRKKILLDDANKFTLIQSHMIITLPVELLNQTNRLPVGATKLHLPLIDLEIENAHTSMKSFILKRVDEKLFNDSAVLDEIIKYGAGHPRQTLQIITRAYYNADEHCLDVKSVEDGIKEMGKEMAVLDEEEMRVIFEIKKGGYPAASDTYLGLKAKNILLDYTDEKIDVINPILEAYALFQNRLDNLNA